MLASLNSERLMSLGFCFSLSPRIKKVLTTAVQRVDYLRRNLAFFNTHPYFASYILGATLKMEEQSQHGEAVTAAEIERVKTHLSRSLGAIGDSLFWRHIKPVSAMVGVAVSLYHEVVGLVVFLLLFNAPHLFVRIHGLVVGYRRGFELVKTIPLANYHLFINFLTNVGSFVAGGLALCFISSERIIGRGENAGAFICGLILMLVFLKWRLPVPCALGVMLLLGLVMGFGF
jgi:mannose/fructose/N-acetylgalactosamine-specific phosphotransferase system component IID